MSPTLTLATARRVLTQVRRDHRTLALIMVLPCVLLGLIAWMFHGTPVLDQFGPISVGIFPMIVMFLVTSVATLRERQSGTLERLLTTPIGRGDLIAGYALAFAIVATVQAVLVVSVTVWLYGMDVAGSLWLVIGVAVLTAVLGTCLGLTASAVARTEFQAVQLMPAVIFPQVILGGLIMPRDQMPDVLEAVSRVLPLSYSIDAMTTVAAGGGLGDVWREVVVLVGFVVGAVIVGSLTLRRQTP